MLQVEYQKGVGANGEAFLGKHVKIVDSSEPASVAFAVEPADGADLETPTRGLYVGVSGDVKVDLTDGGVGLVFKSLAAGIIHPLRVKKVYETGTTATDIVGVS